MIKVYFIFFHDEFILSLKMRRVVFLSFEFFQQSFYFPKKCFCFFFKGKLDKKYNHFL